MSADGSRVPVALRLAAKLLPEEARDEVLGDLLEQWNVRIRRLSLPARLAWAWRQPIEALVARLRFGLRVGGRGLARRRRIPRLAGPGVSWVDVKLGVRMLVKHRGLALIGGLAMTTATVVGAASFEAFTELMRTDLPLDEGDRVVSLHYASDNPGNPERRVLHDFVAWREELESVEQLGAFRRLGRNLVQEDGRSMPIDVAEVTASAFDLTRTPPLLGRHLLPEDERAGGPDVVVIGYRVWRSRFGGDPNIVGRTINLSGVPHEVVGVMPKGFEFPLYHHFWTPLRADPADYERLDGPALYVFGRLAPGVTLGEAQAELTTVERRTAAAYPGSYERLRLLVHPYPREHLFLDLPDIRRLLWSSQFVLGALLLVVFVNLAILVYARTVARQGEIAVRSALGASRRRILAQLFTEAFVLSAIGAATGLLLARILLGTAQSWIERVERLPFWIDLELSGATALYTFALAVLAAVVVGVLPGLKATRRRLHDGLRQWGGGAEWQLGRMWTFLIVAQVGIAVAVLPATLSTVWRLVQIELSGPGFPAEQVVVADVGVSPESSGPGSDPAEDQARLDARVRDRQLALIRRLEAEPGVSAVALSSAVPLFELGRWIELDDASAELDMPSRVYTLQASPGLFDIYHAELLAGRAFEAGDPDHAAMPVIVNRTFVERVLGGRNPLGRSFRYREGGNQPDVRRPQPSHEIVGVVSDFPDFAPLPGRDWEPKVYHPIHAGDVNPVHLSVSFAGAVPAGFTRRVRRMAVEVDPAMPVQAQVLSEYYDEQLAPIRSVTWVLALVMVSVLLLSAAGIHALMSFTVEKRTREIGIRSALGAPRRRVLLAIFARAARQLTVGLGVGAVLAAALFATFGSDPIRSSAYMVAVAALMLGVGLLAALGPALRGLRIQPTEALRGEG